MISHSSWGFCHVLPMLTCLWVSFSASTTTCLPLKSMLSCQLRLTEDFRDGFIPRLLPHVWVSLSLSTNHSEPINMPSNPHEVHLVNQSNWPTSHQSIPKFNQSKTMVQNKIQSSLCAQSSWLPWTGLVAAVALTCRGGSSNRWRSWRHRWPKRRRSSCEGGWMDDCRTQPGSFWF